MGSKNRSKRVKIRKNSLLDNRYLDRGGQWVTWRNAAWFVSERTAHRFARRHGIKHVHHDFQYGEPVTRPGGRDPVAGTPRRVRKRDHRCQVERFRSGPSLRVAV